jgi:hypothetical protein
MGKSMIFERHDTLIDFDRSITSKEKEYVTHVRHSIFTITNSYIT